MTLRILGSLRYTILQYMRCYNQPSVASLLVIFLTCYLFMTVHIFKIWIEIYKLQFESAILLFLNSSRFLFMDTRYILRLFSLPLVALMYHKSLFVFPYTAVKLNIPDLYGVLHYFVYVYLSRTNVSQTTHVVIQTRLKR